MDYTQDTPPPKVATTLKLYPAEKRAFDLLVQAGYSFPADSMVGVVRKMLRKTWEEEFPGVPFPEEKGEQNE